MARTRNNAPCTEYQQDGFAIRLFRSARRRRTVSARLVNWRLVEVRAPMHIDETELSGIISHLLQGIKMKQAQQRQVISDDDLQTRAALINRRYFDGRLTWRSIAYVDNQRQRFGSCSPQLGTIRISDRLKRVPGWVLDYVLIHELAHLQEPAHSQAFWRLVNRYEKAERARGYLIAMQMLEDEEDSAIPPKE